MRAAALLLLALVAAGCLEGPRGPPGSATDPTTFRTLAHDSDSGIRVSERTVLATRDAYEAAWARHASGPNPKGEAPDVDFTRERVVLVALGEKGSGCHGIEVENVTRDGDAVLVHVLVVGPTPATACPAVMVQPVHFVAIATTTGAIEFRERGVGTPERPPPSPSEPDAERLSVRELDRGSFSGIREDTRVHLRTLQAWHDLWQRHDDISAPGVSFPNESVVAVVEHGPTGCFGIHVGNVTFSSRARAITVEVVHERTPPNVQCIQALQDAYHFVAIPDRPGTVRFVDVDGDPGAGEPGPGAGAARGALETRSLAAGGASGVREAMREVFSERSEWVALWSEHASIMDPAPPAPDVDFATERVFVATLGEKPNGCWAVRVTLVEETEEELRIEVTTYPPPADMMCTQVVSHPHHFVAFPASAKPLEVVERSSQDPPPDV